MNEIQFKAQLAAQVLPVAVEMVMLDCPYSSDNPDPLESKSISRAIKIAETIIERISNS